MDFVSIIIPCYRQGRYLAQAIDSALGQSHSEIEVIVVNDGSDDNTDEVAAQYEARIRYIRQENAGLPGARNTGLAHASGKYVVFLDSDDLLHPRAVEWLLGATGGRSDGLAICGWRKYRDDFEHPIEEVRFPEGGDLFPGLIHDNPGPPHCYLAPRELVDSVGGFRMDLRSCEDWDLWLRVAFTGANVWAVREMGALYRISAGQMSSNRPRMLATRIEVLMHTFRAFQQQPELMHRWGDELATAAVRVRRRLKAQRLYPESVTSISTMIRELSRLGHSAHLTPKEAAVARLLGTECVDTLVLSYYRLFDRAAFDFYRKGYA